MYKFKNIKLPGMRVIKTALAIVICLLIMEIANEKYSVYSAVVAIVCMQRDWMDTLQASKDRFVGTFLGALFGLITYLIIIYFNLADFTLLSYLIIGIASIVLMMTTIAINNSEITAITCIIFLSIISFRDMEASIYYFTLRKIIDTFVGISVALLINITLNDNFVSNIKNKLSIKK